MKMCKKFIEIITSSYFNDANKSYLLVASGCAWSEGPMAVGTTGKAPIHHQCYGMVEPLLLLGPPVGGSDPPLRGGAPP
jgi:hypothetical protein